MEFKTLMQSLMDLVSDVRDLDNRLFNLCALNDLNECDKKRLIQTRELTSKINNKAIELNSISIQYLRKKFDRKNNKRG